MHEPNVQHLLKTLRRDELVLDVGGWACPFNRAQWVLDAEPFETRGSYRTFGGAPSQGGEREWFSRDTWVQRDICDRAPWPFADQQFDYAICSHTLEDVRDPLWVCSELCRVATRGYIEVPSRAFEATLGIERPSMAGLSHHRWLIDIAAGEIVFLQKLHMIHSHWRFALPPSFAKRLTAESAVQWLWWDQSFRFREEAIHGLRAQERALEEFVRNVQPYPAWKVASSRYRAAFSAQVGRARSWTLRRWRSVAVSGARQ